MPDSNNRDNKESAKANRALKLEALYSPVLRRTLREERRASKRYKRDFYYEHYFDVKLPITYFLPGVFSGFFIALFLGIISGVLLQDFAYFKWFFVAWGAYLCFSLFRYGWLRIGWGSGAVRSNSVIESVPGVYRYDIAQRPVDIGNYISQKPNRNLFICGTSGEGKSFLMRYMLEQVGMQKIIFNFKPNDECLRLGYPIVDMSRALPNPFNDTEAFVNAFLITFPIASIGITAQYVPIMLRDIAESSNSWQDFGDTLRRAISKTKDRIQLSALLYIEEHANALISTDTNVIGINDDDIALDFSTLKNEDSKTFYAELILRTIWKRLSGGNAKEMLLCIDEAHRLLHKFEKYESIYVEMSRQIRAFGMLWASSQNFTDMNDDIRNQFATQFCFNTTHPDDLRALELADKKLSWAASSMPLHFFTDARYEWLHDVVPEFILHYEPVDKPRVYFDGVRPEKAAKESVMAVSAKSIDYDKEIKLALEKEGVAHASKIARIIAQKYNIDPAVTKLHILNNLRKLLNSAEINSMRASMNLRSYLVYYNRNRNISGLHNYMQRFVSTMLVAHGIKVISEAVSGQGTADIETQKFDVEIETGLKNRMDDLKRRIIESGKLNVIVVPNSAVAERYLIMGMKDVEVATMAGFEELLTRKLVKL